MPYRLCGLESETGRVNENGGHFVNEYIFANEEKSAIIVSLCKVYFT